MVSGWRLIRADTSEEPDLYDGIVVKAFNRFANMATAVLIDDDGSKAAIYIKGYQVLIQAYDEVALAWVDLIGGFVIDNKRDTDTTVLEILSHDFWLRRREVFKTYTGQYISAILQDLIDNYTPLTWDAGLVSVLNDQQITRTWKGERLDSVINELASISGQEEFGATSDRKFFFRERETTAASRNFLDGEFTDAAFEDIARDEINKVVVYYGRSPSTGIVTVQDLDAQLELQETIGADDPVVLETTVHYPDIDNEDAARNKGRDILLGVGEIQTGILHSWDGYDLIPGQTTRVEAIDEGVDDSFRIASLTYRYLDATTDVVVAEDDEGVLDALVSLTKESDRIDVKEADLTATLVETASITQKYQFAMTVKAFTMTVPATMFLCGDHGGNVGDIDVGGGYLGDSRGNKQELTL